VPVDGVNDKLPDVGVSPDIATARVCVLAAAPLTDTATRAVSRNSSL
jgi:hypothetical protein